MKKIPEKLKSHVINNDILRETINALIDYHTPEPKTCGTLMSVGAFGHDSYCDNPKPCHLHDKVIDNNKFEPALQPYSGSVCQEYLKNGVCEHTYKLQEAVNRAYAKGQENGKKQGRKEERERCKKLVETYTHSNMSIEDLLNQLQ